MDRAYTTFEKKVIRHAISLASPFQLIDIFQLFLFDPADKEVKADEINEALQTLAEEGVLRTDEKPDGDYYVIGAAAAARLKKSGII